MIVDRGHRLILRHKTAICINLKHIVTCTTLLSRLFIDVLVCRGSRFIRALWFWRVCSFPQSFSPLAILSYPISLSPDPVTFISLVSQCAGVVAPYTNHSDGFLEARNPGLWYWNRSKYKHHNGNHARYSSLLYCPSYLRGRFHNRCVSTSRRLHDFRSRMLRRLRRQT